ncbi:hypothetical protein [Halocatena salina]|uniref:Uncharacterized protein n=1 Tax=Halocatena salina TaxID=2934340 RepID=A0A8U0A1G2_9EURY|nr:hypothetical protein [Halocatena salina]UPM42914.1 hypothetical protein MW046_00310 [Halocatena salina]
MSNQSAATQNISDEHTLIVETTGDPVQYTISATENISGETDEGDAIQGRTLSGRVGGVPWDNTTDDTTDTVTYTGYIDSFQHRGDDLQLRLGGQEISPAILSGNHLQIVRSNSSNGSPINYEITVTGDATPGESTENQDQTTVLGGANGTQIQGQLTDQYDSFYFTGNATVTSIDQQALVYINGRNVTGQNTGAGTPTVTQPTPIGGAATGTPITTAAGNTTHTQSTDGAGADSAQSSTGGDRADSSGSTSPLDFLLRLASGLILVALVVVAVWYFLPRQQRW